MISYAFASCKIQATRSLFFLIKLYHTVLVLESTTLATSTGIAEFHTVVDEIYKACAHLCLLMCTYGRAQALLLD
jgi:hypothetical protein